VHGRLGARRHRRLWHRRLALRLGRGRADPAYGYADKIEAFRTAYAQWGAWIILLKGLTPIPYKVVTITSGFAGYSLGLFVVFSLITRGTRFFVLAFLLHRYGEQARHIIERQLGWWTMGLAATVVAGMVAALYLV